jgi:glycosyltransferase involved in cell wall biosynthesis
MRFSLGTFIPTNCQFFRVADSKLQKCNGSELSMSVGRSGKDHLTLAIAANKFGWIGGIDFLAMVADGLLEFSKDVGHRVVILQRGGGIVYFLRNLVKASPAIGFDASSFCERGAIEIKVDDGPIALACALLRSRADVVLPLPNPPLRGIPNLPLVGNYIRWVGYIYDLQHKHLSHNFTAAEATARDIQFERVLNSAKSVVVNSHAVAEDIARFYGQCAAKLFVLPFAPAAITDWFEDCSLEIKDYNLPERYFMICNQFWVHKDHITAFKAMKLLTAESADISLICTGAVSDYRHPEYWPGLLKWIDANGMSNRIRILGYIPKRHQIEIMKHALAVIQPSRFEGGPGGGAVYDAIGIGVPVIVSDIPVNREIPDDTVYFFSAGDFHDLSAKMWRVINAPPTRSTRDVLLQRGRARRKLLGAAVVKAALTAMQ